MRRITRTAARLALACTLFALAAAPAPAGEPRVPAAAYVYRYPAATRQVGPVAPPRPLYYVAAPSPAPAPAVVATGQPGAFLGWLNATRARHGLAAVGWDPNLANWAAMNNAQQNARGIGHYVMGPARRQNSAMGSGASIGPMWMNSPAHRAALLDPSIRFIGLAGSGAYWTMNAF